MRSCNTDPRSLTIRSPCLDLGLVVKRWIRETDSPFQSGQICQQEDEEEGDSGGDRKRRMLAHSHMLGIPCSILPSPSHISHSITCTGRANTHSLSRPTPRPYPACASVCYLCDQEGIIQQTSPKSCKSHERGSACVPVHVQVNIIIAASKNSLFFPGLKERRIFLSSSDKRVG